jgi:2-polyprenyl-6-methoxyphenol hydroxylase-like FAD-dependent oxidoreductase
MPDLGGGLDHAIAVHRTDLHRLLLEAVAGRASVDTRFEWAAVSADPSGAVRITSTAANGPDFRSMSLQADVIVGADWANSAVRSTGGFVSRVSSASSYVRTIVRGRASAWFEEYWTPPGSFGQAPLLATWSTFGLQPMWPGRLRRCLAATLGLSARSGDGFYPPRRICSRGCRLSTTC